MRTKFTSRGARSQQSVDREIAGRQDEVVQQRGADEPQEDVGERPGVGQQ
jgi:hypothetical protein